MKATKNIRRFQVCAVLSIAMSYGLPAISQGGETCPTNSSGPDICVSFDGDAPVEDVHFSVDYTTDPANPSVELLVGSLTWNVRSDDSGSPGNIGTISIDPTVPSSADFEVTIANGTDPGAANVGTMNLKSPSFLWTGYSSIEGASHITGSLTGPLTVIKDSGGVGGELTLMIGGDVSGAITVPVLKSLLIGGDLSANITVTDKMKGGTLDVDGSVTSAVMIDIADMVSDGGSGSNLNFGTVDSPGLEFAGDLLLETGLKVDQVLNIDVPLTSTATIDFSGANIASYVYTRWWGWGHHQRRSGHERYVLAGRERK